MLRGTDVAFALPALECMTPILTAQETSAAEPRRMVAICFELSLHPPNLIPTAVGREYELPL